MKFCTGIAGAVINILFAAGAALLWQVSALQHLSRQVNAELRSELRHYRIIMLAPRLVPPETTGKPKVRRAGKNAPTPLAVPNTRILRGLDPAIRYFVEEDPELEGVVTREIVRDVDSKALDVRRLLEKSSIRISFGLDDAGHILWRRIDESSSVASVDHLALELVRLLEKYNVLQVVAGIDEVKVSIRVDRQVEIALEGHARPEARIDAIKGRVEAGLILWRLFVPEDEATSYLQDVTIVTQQDRLLVSKVYDKDSIIKLMELYYQPDSTK